MKINFIVRSDKRGQPATVYLRYSESRLINKEVSTPEKIYPEYWSGKQGRLFKPNIAYNTVFTQQAKVETEGRLNELRQFISSSRLSLKQDVTKEWLNLTVDRYYNRIQGGENINGYITRVFAEMKSGVRLNGSRRFAANTTRSYSVFKNAFSEYQGIYSDVRKRYFEKRNIQLRRLRPLNFNDITTDFFSDFMSYCNEKGFRPNNTSMLIQRLKTTMRMALDEGLHNNTEFKRRGFSVHKQPIENVYLTEDEVRLLFNLDLSFDKTMEKVRDIFLCGCYTAQRYSDFSNYRKENIKTYSGNKVLEFNQTKTGEKCIVPLRPEINIILKKYDYTLPFVRYQTLINMIPIICQKAGLDEMVSYEEYKGGFRLKKQVPKYELIKTHTARRSGATNMYLAGIPTLDIMKIGGWKTESSFLKYIKVTKEQTAVNLASHPFFTGNTFSIAK